MKIWFTVSEGAEYAGVSRDTIYTACEWRELHPSATTTSGSKRCRPRSHGSKPARHSTPSLTLWTDFQ